MQDKLLNHLIGYANREKTAVCDVTFFVSGLIVTGTLVPESATVQDMVTKSLGEDVARSISRSNIADNEGIVCLEEAVIYQNGARYNVPFLKLSLSSLDGWTGSGIPRIL